MKNRYTLLLVTTLTALAKSNSINPGIVTKAIESAHYNGLAFNNTQHISSKQQYGFFKDLSINFGGKQDPRNHIQCASDKLHTQKRFWMFYGAVTTLGYIYAIKHNPDLPEAAIDHVADKLANLIARPFFAIKQLIKHSDYDGPNPFQAAEKAADDAALL